MDLNINNLSIKTKILIIIGIDLLLILFSIFSSYKESEQMHDVRSKLFTNSKAVYHQLTADMMHDAVRSDCYAAMSHKDKDELKNIEKDLNRHSAIFKNHFDSLQSLPLTNSIAKNTEKIKKDIDTYLQTSKKIIELSASKGANEHQLDSLKKHFNMQFYTMESSMEKISREINTISRDLEIEGKETFEKSIYLKVVLIITIIILGFLVITYINKSIVSPLKEMQNILQDLSLGKETYIIKKHGNDEIGKMQDSINDIAESLDNIKLFSQEVSQGKTDNNTIIFNNTGEVYKHLQDMRQLVRNKTKELENTLYLSQQKNEEIAVINEELHATQEELKQNLDYATQVNQKLKSTESEITNHIDFIDALLSSTELSIISLNAKGTIKIFNKGAEKLLGYSADEMIDKQTPEIIHDANEVKARAETLSLELKRTINPGLETFHAKSDLGHTDTNEWTYIHKNKTRIPVLLSVSTLRNNKNEILGYLGIAVDLRERKKQEALIIKTIKEKEIAEETAKSKELFLANMSHEIRTPMNAILGLSRLLEKSGELNARQQEYVKTIHLNSNNLLNIINEILDFSKIESGKLDLQRREFHLINCIQTTFKSLENSALDKGLIYELEIDHRIAPYVVADDTRLTQIILNLLSNAIKYTESGKIKMQVQELSNDNLLQTIRFSISDTGVGIPADKIDLIFNPFSQVENDYSRKQGGTGLGLAIVKRIAELYGSFIQVRSEVNKGSEFSFIISFEISNNTIAKTIPNEEDKKNEDNTRLNILLVEDNEFNKMVAIDTLKFWKPNINIDSAENGNIALEKIKMKNYQLILMDLQMPIMDGYETTKYIRNVLNLKTPILAMTAHASTKEKEKCLALGMNDFISKPFEESILFEKIISLTKIGMEINSVEDILATEEKEYTVIDIDAIMSFTKGKKERIEKMVNMFLTDTPLEIEKMKTLYQEKNYSSLRTLAHSLKPKMGYMGLESLRDVAKTIEISAGNETNLEEIPNLIKAIESTCEEAYQEMKKMIENFGNK